MLTIQALTIDKSAKQLIVTLADASGGLTENWCFSFEFLRVIEPPSASNSHQLSNAKKAIVSHKKDVMLTSIESIGKHGFRVIFDDGFSCCYDQNQFALLHQQRELLWQHYLDELKATGHSRDAMIDIQQL